MKTWADYRIRCATYNVNDKLPPKGTTELASLVGDGSDDILVFGFQEAGTFGLWLKLMIDVRHQALLFAQGNDRAAAWEEALFRGLGDRASEFEKVKGLAIYKA
jgi:phosphatidylinositol-bisphosphatase